jgi:hypothetical protein
VGIAAQSGYRRTTLVLQSPIELAGEDSHDAQTKA